MKTTYRPLVQRAYNLGGVIKSLLLIALIVGLMTTTSARAAGGSISKSAYGKTADGIAVDEYTMTNANKIEVKIITYGGTVTSLKVPDRNGNWASIVLGFDKLSDYETMSPYFGAIIGRYGNRIAKGKFTLDGKEYTLAVNNGKNTLHGGKKGFDKQVWDAKPIEGFGSEALELSRISKDGEEGYPGNLTVKVVYTLTDKNELKIDYTATTDKDTVINLTHHSYFNMAGNGSGSIDNQILMINADKYVPIDDGGIPTGDMTPVDGTPFDFRSAKQIGPAVRSSDPQIINGRGIDHSFVLNRTDDKSLQMAARLYDPASGRTMDIWATEPGLEVYTGNFLDGTLHGSSGGMYRQGEAICLEPQHFPDSPNQPKFPSTTLKPGDTYTTSTVFKFTTN
ncbi:MAG: aldose epimerase family protein [Chloroflexota bacterium]